MAGIKNRKEYSYEENHKEVKGIIYKKCSIHKELYSAEDEWFPCTLEYFYKNDKNKIDGLHPNCKKCAIKKATQWKKGQTEEYKKELSEKHKEIVKRDYKIDKNGIRTIIRAMGKIQRESGYQAQWRRDHPEKLKIYNSLHRIHGITKTEEEAILRIFNYSCAYCGLTEKEQLIKFKQKLHNDHVDDDGYNDLRNDVPACKSCNCGKWKHPFEEWYKQQKFFDEEKYNKIIWWTTEGYKEYIEDKPPYKIIKKKNKDNNKFHHELWIVDEYRNMVEFIYEATKKKDVKDFADRYFIKVNKKE